ncbi:SLBB domain-containing protein [Pseudoalteromonas luteoviolacea]|uniref:SLBB domain-containing protein n=1 Tax=Pseudoalteromonas luteoviolacea TaxID=43657 RepID=UPI001B3A5981|nr:SLBB domain-containing protein [Pseudoalteromonas luteoviolacea]MBQ4876815.1 SLBB domain-containing protein [Pseudoalteromonas luteoviolacea]MBQ4905396.1 SLBB domain-containing protein [Pseudoalteromonas luteoviolacea]
MYFKHVLAIVLLGFGAFASAFTPTAQQIEQFKKLPQSQQETLAKQYGIDLSSIGVQSNNEPQGQANEKSILPRKDNSIEDTPDPLKPEETELKPYGYELFAGEPTSFAPTEQLSVPNDYIISNGDSFSVSLYGKDAATHLITVDREGRLNIPDFSPIYVAGLAYGELKELIDEKISNEAIGLKVFVSISELRSLRVLVVGEAHKPGSYSLSPLSTVTHALFASGGLSEIASLRNIQVKRRGKIISQLDLYDLLLKGDSSGDVTLQSGDVVFIPSVGRQVSVEGFVKRPAIFELKDGETAKSLVNMFGGFKENAFLEQVEVKRVIEHTKKSVISVDFTQNKTAYTPQGGDYLKVKSVNSEVIDSVTLIGAVSRPGYYEWKNDITFDQLVSNTKTDLLPQADVDYALIVREITATNEIEVIQFSIVEALKTKNVFLNKNDEVFVFSRFNDLEKEEAALKNLALTETEQELQEKVKLWHLYERRQFDQKVLFDMALNEALLDESEEEVEIKVEEEITPTTFGRETLLAPILAQLEYQATVGSSKATFEVDGQVRFPGVFPLAKGLDVKAAITAAGGLLESAYVDFAEVTRVSPSGDVTYIKVTDIDKELSTDSILLQGRDTLNILMQPNWQESYKVHLKGEVVFPGTYTIKRGDTLQEVLARAGGITGFAEPKAAIFTREAIKEQEQKQLKRLSEDLRKDIASKSFQKSIGSNTSLTYEETNKLLKDLASVEALGRLVIDLPSILEERTVLSLQDGDTLHVPGRQDSISIIGEVNYSSSHLFREGTSIEDYINLSGGMRDRADEEKVYVIKANGAVFIPNRSSWFAVNNTIQLEAGDTIVVPMDASHMDSLTLWSTATQIFYQLGVGIAAIARI